MAARQRLICRSGDLADGGDGVRFETRSAGQAAPAFVIRYRGKVYGYLNRCAHIPAEMDWQPGKFFDHSGLYLICATHGALYAPDSGRCLGGRCEGRGLRALAVSECDGSIYICEESD